MADIYYKGSTGREIHFDNQTYYLNRATDLFAHQWSYSNSEYADKIESFSMKFVRKNFELGIIARTDSAYDEALRTIDSVFDYDVRANKPGKLYVNDRYLNCYIIENNQSVYDTRVRKVLRPYVLIAEDGQWIKEQTYATIPIDDPTVDKGIDFEYDYPHDYAWDSTFERVQNDSVAEADFRLTMYGPAILPSVSVGENIYSVLTDIQIGCKVVIDSISKTVKYIDQMGKEENIFNLRLRGMDIFKKIPIGTSELDRNGLFDVTLVVYDYRSEPEWWK